MVPLVGMRSELDKVKAAIDATAEQVRPRNGRRGSLFRRDHDRTAAGRAAGPGDRRKRRVLLVRHQRPDPDHFGISRDDATGFIGPYQSMGVIEKDPFMTLDSRAWAF
jgi:pyruvate,orthophosphate dikinase